METKKPLRILIAGATGVLGSALAHHLLDKGYKVVAVGRKSDLLKSLENAGAHIVQADFSRPESFHGLCSRVDVVIPTFHQMMSKSVSDSQRVDWEGHVHLIEEAKTAGVQHFIYPSVQKAAPDHPIDFFVTKYKVEERLKLSGLHYTILRLPAFMEWHAWRLIGASLTTKHKASIFGSGENPINFIAVDDIVKVIVYLIENPTAENRTEHLAGPDNLSRNQVAASIAKALNQPLKLQHMPIGLLRVIRPLIKPFHAGIARIMQLAMVTEHSNESLPPSYTIARFGLSPTYMQDFIQKMIKEYKSG